MSPAAQGNVLLASLPRRTQSQLTGLLDAVELEFGDLLIEQGEPIRYVYFPVDALVSMLSKIEGHPALEVGLIGHEGLVGVGIALGASISPLGALIQGGGTAMRIAVQPFRKALEAHPPLQRRVLGFAGALMSQISQTAACNRFHRLDQRLARWLLMSSDRLRLPEFRMTQEFLGHMLGARRVGVTEAAHELQQRHVIDYRRGMIRILDRTALEAASCDCYRQVQEIYARVAELP